MAFLGLCVALSTRIFLPYPLAVLLDTNGAEEVAAMLHVLSLPVVCAYRLIEDVHIAAGILIEEELCAILGASCHAALDFICIQNSELAHLSHLNSAAYCFSARLSRRGQPRQS